MFDSMLGSAYVHLDKFFIDRPFFAFRKRATILACATGQSDHEVINFFSMLNSAETKI